MMDQGPANAYQAVPCIYIYISALNAVGRLGKTTAEISLYKYNAQVVSCFSAQRTQARVINPIKATPHYISVRMQARDG